MGYKIEEERLVFYTKKFLCLGCMVDILAVYREVQIRICLMLVIQEFEVSEVKIIDIFR